MNSGGITRNGIFTVILVSVKRGFSDLSIALCGVPGLSAGPGFCFILMVKACEHKAISKAFWMSTSVLCAATA